MKFKDLKFKGTPAQLAANEARVRKTLESMSLEQIRAKRELTQVAVAKKMGVKQAAVSKMERQGDMYMGSIKKLVAAMGGTIEIHAVFPDQTVLIKFEKGA